MNQALWPTTPRDAYATMATGVRSGPRHIGLAGSPGIPETFRTGRASARSPEPTGAFTASPARMAWANLPRSVQAVPVPRAIL